MISAGTSFALEVMKKPLSMGADELVLLQDDLFNNTIDSFQTAFLLSEAIKKLGGFDLIICGRQASDWDNAQVPLGVAELLGAVAEGEDEFGLVALLSADAQGLVGI